MSEAPAPFTPEQEDRIREILHLEQDRDDEVSAAWSRAGRTRDPADVRAAQEVTARRTAQRGR